MTVKTVAGIATLKSREESFKQTIDSIYPQVDRIYAVLNNYDRIPAWIKNKPKIIAVLGHNNLGDAAKFLFVDICENCYYFSFDDDLVYPDDYCLKMIAAVDKYKCIVTLHGKRYNKGTKDYRKDFLFTMHCLRNTPMDIRLDLGGDGCMAFHTRDFHPTIGGFLKPNMSNIWISAQAAEQGVPIMGISHHKGYLKYIPPVDTPIWDKNIDGEYQTKIINDFLKKT